MTAIREGLIHDLAESEEGLSTAQRVLIDRVVTFLGVVRLIEEHAREHGVLDSKGRLTSGLTAHYLSFNRHIKENLALLGIQKREPDLPMPWEVEAEEKTKAEASAKNL